MVRQRRNAGGPDRVLALIALLQSLIVAVSGPATSPEYLPIWVAAADGHFSRQGLKVTVRSTRSEVGAAEALAQGQADLAATSLEALLRFGSREGQSPRLLLGLTAAPPVALVVSTSHAGRVRGVRDLSGLRVGISAPGAGEHSWFYFLLSRANLTPAQVHVLSVGATGLERALTRNDVQAALLPEPLANRLLRDGHVALVADLRTPDAAQRTLGLATVNAGVFVRADRRPGERELAAFTRAIISAEGRIAAGRAGDLAERLPRDVVEHIDTFDERVAHARRIYLTDGRVTVEHLDNTAGFLRDQVPLPGRARVQLLPPGRIKTTPGR
jgi:NitT/TauT family transport system substrate-binding protein